MEKVGNYQFTRNNKSELGRGSYSVVYIGLYCGPTNKYLENGKKVALKVIKTTNLTQKALSILKDEMSIMNMIKEQPHPNIVECYDIIECETELFLIMEYCDSGDLKSILKKPIKEKYAQFYFCQLANGLKYLDSCCIVHRDIKPKNILLTNNRRILKIADFGFATKITNQSLHDTMCGSPLYMAPEIINNNLYNNQIDLWSVGMILYEMLYGVHPFSVCRSIPELRQKVEKDIIEIPPCNTKNTDVSNDCISLLNKLLQKKAEKRITWNEFFNHPWVNAYSYTVQKNNNQYDYENKLKSTSIGSLSNDQPSILSLLVSSSPKKIRLSQNTPNSNEDDSPIVKMSFTDKITIIDDYYDNVMPREQKIQKKPSSKFNSDDFIFDMELENETDKKEYGK